jgi:hypothetical protein
VSFEARNDGTLDQIDGKSHPLVFLIDVGERRRAGARADNQRAAPIDFLQG